MRQKVLVIDDSASILALVRARLSDEAIEIVTAADGTAGLEAARAQSPDAILLDVDMPELNGFEVCRRLKGDLLTMNIPIIFLTGASSTEEKIRGIELGAIDYVTKPFDPAELRARVRGALRLKFLVDLLSRKAQIDALTGLWNRAYLQHSIEEKISLARRHGPPLSLLVIDLDHFKKINDQYGHPFGDETLKAAAAAITNAVRIEDVVCRYGGEEFVVLAPSTNAAGAAALAERIRSAISEIVLHHRATNVSFTASIGTATLDAASDIPLLEAADQALYEAKHQGRNRVCAHQPALAEVRG